MIELHAVAGWGGGGTCEPVSMVLSFVVVAVFQNRMHRSAVPPPDASKPCWCGDQAMALTAAEWSENFMAGVLLFNDQMHSWLSLPPDASWRLSGDHLSPHTSERCAAHLHKECAWSHAPCKEPYNESMHRIPCT
jgi:hypothetical protein